MRFVAGKTLCLSHRLVQLRGVLGKAHPFDNKYFRESAMALPPDDEGEAHGQFDGCGRTGHN